MLPVFTKRLDAITSEDVTELVTQHWPEGYEVEFKQTLSHEKGERDPWLRGEDKIGNYARDGILAEIVAFANAAGGTLVLGVAETKTRGIGRASQIVPLPRIHDLVRRFEDMARDCIDPPLRRLEVWPVLMTEEGGGVAIFRTAASRAAPHRLSTTRECFVRRGASTVKMTMREIQNMTLDVALGAAGIDSSFVGRRDAFEAWQTGHSVALRVTAMPLQPLPDPGRLFGRQEMFPDYPESIAQVDSSGYRLDFPCRPWTERPVVRGVRRYRSDPNAFQYELFRSGLIDLWFAQKARDEQQTRGYESRPVELLHGTLLACVINVLKLLDHYRSALGVPTAEYGLEVEVQNRSLPLARGVYAGLTTESRVRHELPRETIILPRLSVGPLTEFDALVSSIDTDIYDALGNRLAPASIRVTWSPS